MIGKLVYPFFIFFIFLGCTSTQSLPEADSNDKSGTELWSENCSRCHNAPPPSAFDNEEWEVAGLHMRMRTYLTGAEVKKIQEFLTGKE